jgi:hypothetical protein
MLCGQSSLKMKGKVSIAAMLFETLFVFFRSGARQADYQAAPVRLVTFG